MDLFATLFSIVSNTPESEPETYIPIDADNGDRSNRGGGCIVA